MGGLMHLFDFNQALSGRKLPTEKKLKSGLTPAENSSHAEGSFAEATKLKARKKEDTQYQHETPTGSTLRKSNGMPVKALIKRESSKGPDVKDHTPSVVARLMGLEALPMGSKTLQKTQPTNSKTLNKPQPTSPKTLHKGSTGKVIPNIDEKTSHKVIIERQHHQDKLSHNVRQFTKAIKASAITGQHTSNLQQNRMEYDEENEVRYQPFQNHPQEEQFEELRKDFDALRSQKLGHSKKLAKNDNSSLSQIDKHEVLYQKMHRADVREKHSSSKISTREERFRESRELQDTLNFLQTNKDFFMKFIQESKSFLPRHEQEDCMSSNFLPHPSQTTKARYSHPMPDESYRPQPRAKDSSRSRINCRSGDTESSTEDAAVDTNEFNVAKSPPSCSEESLGYQQYADPSLVYGANYQVPTRIVVLKPSSARARNFKPSSPTYSSSPKDHVADSTVALEELLEKLRKDKEREHERKNARSSVNEYHRDALNDCREIAREIARKARENITRDHINGSLNSKNGHKISDHLNLSRRLRDTDGEALTTTSGLSSGNPASWSSSMLLDQDKKLSLEVVNKGGKRGVSQQTREKVARILDKIIPHVDNTPTSNGVCSEASSYPSSPDLRISPSSKVFESPSLDEIESDQRYRRALFHSYPQNSVHMKSSPECGMESFNHEIYVEKGKPKSHTGLIATSVEQNQEELQVCSQRINLGDLPEMGMESLDDLRKTADETRSIGLMPESDYNKAASQLKISSNVTEVDQMPFEDDGSIVHKKDEELLMIHVKQQSIDDPDNLAVDNDFSLSSFTSITPEPHKKVHQCGGNDTICEMAAEHEVGYGSQTTDIISVLNDRYSNQHHLLEEPRVIHPPVNIVALIENNGPLKVESEQPSPVSILDFPYEEEASVSREYKMNSDLQELQTCHRRLHFDVHDEALAKVSWLAGDEIECKKHAISQCNDNVISDDLNCTDLILEEIRYSSGKEAELLYVRDVLLASGVIGERTLLASFHAPHQLVNSNLFEKMENNYLGKESKLLNPDRTIGAMLSPSQRRLLFDSVYEILYNILGHRLTSSKLTTSDIDIFKHVRLHIHQLLCSHSDSQYTLENLVMNDVGKKGQWFDNGLEVEALGLEMERMIIDDLIEELLLDF